MAMHATAHDCCSHSGLGEHRARTDAICVDHVSFAYKTNGNASRSVSPVLSDVTLHIEQGSSLGIIGPNGAGKTTLLKIMLGLLDGYSGSVQVLGLPPRAACRRGDLIGYVPQRHNVEWRFPLTVRQVVRMGLVGKTGVFRRYSRDDLDYAESLLERVGIAEMADRPIGDLSGGQQQRCFMARALAPRPKILILDEPLANVDEAGQRQFADLIRSVHQSLELTIVIVSHDLRAVAAGCSSVACLNRTVHYHDVPSGLSEDLLREVFQHEISWVLDSRYAPPAGEKRSEVGSQRSELP